MNSCVASSVLLLWTMMLKYSRTSTLVPMWNAFFWLYSWHMNCGVVLYAHLPKWWKTACQLTTLIYTALSSIVECQNLLMSYFNFCPSNYCEIIFHWGFNLHFFNYELSWASYCMFYDHSCLTMYKMPVYFVYF